MLIIRLFKMWSKGKQFSPYCQIFVVIISPSDYACFQARSDDENSERIADGEVQGVGILKAFNVEVSPLAGVVWYMQSNTPVKA